MKIGVVTDVHLTDPTHPPDRFHNIYDYAQTRANFESALRRHRLEGVDAIAMLGDLANAGDYAYHLLGLDLCAAIGLPVWIVPGNHDCEEDAHALATRLAAAKQRAIQIPTPTGEIVDGVRIAGLPTSLFDTERNWEVATPEVEAWGQEPVLLLSHVPALSRAKAAGDAELNYAGDVGNHEAIAGQLRRRSAPTIVLHGHLHLRDSVIDGTVLQIGFASIVEPPHESAIVVINVAGDSVLVSVCHEAVAVSNVERLPILSPVNSIWQFDDGRWRPRHN